MPRDDYKRFLSFLRKHDCQVPFHAFRGVRERELAQPLEVEEHRHVAVV
jgi:hypothetical protein